MLKRWIRTILRRTQLLSQAYHRIGLEDDARQEAILASKIHEDNRLKLDGGS